MKAAPMATVPSAKAALRKGTWSWTAPLELLVVVVGVVELLLEVEDLEPEVEALEEEGVGEELLPAELFVDEFDAADVRCKKKEENWDVCVGVWARTRSAQGLLQCLGSRLVRGRAVCLETRADSGLVGCVCADTGGVGASK
jgi:hypothetical protein